jgi:iron complex outermembrane receptor protein
LDLAAYYNYIDDYIFLGYTADTTDEGLSVYRYQQNNAMLYGFEAMMEILPVKNLDIKLAYNYNRGKVSADENLPFIPHNKLLSEAQYTFKGILRKGSLYLKIGGDYAFAQNHPSAYETSSPSWFLLNAGAGIEIPVADHRFSFSIQIRNLLNTSYIDHLSVLKEMDYGNIGRNVVLSVSVPFSIQSGSD